MLDWIKFGPYRDYLALRLIKLARRLTTNGFVDEYLESAAWRQESNNKYLRNY